MATKDGRAQIWYADGNGNVEGFSETVDDIAETIISTYNEHFGTDIQIWTPETKNLQVGGTVPNWNAYEKISNLRWQIQFAGTNGVFGIIENKTYKVYANNASNVLIASNEGVVVGTQNYSSDFGNFMKNKLVAAGLDVQSVEQFITSLNVGDNVPEWSLYNITN